MSDVAYCCELYFEAKILAPHPNLTSDAALYVFNPAVGCVVNRSLRTPVYSALNAEARGLYEVPHKDPEAKAAYDKAYYAANKEKRAAWKAANKDRIKSYRSSEEIAAYNAAFREANPEYWKAYYRSERFKEFDAKRRATPEYRKQAAINRKKLLASPEYRAKVRVRQQAWQAKRDPEEVKASRIEYAKRPEVVAARRARYAKRLADPIKVAADRERARRWASKPENRIKASYRYASDTFKLHRRMSSAMRRCLKGNKKSKWLDLVSYTAEQLRNHIERQFPPKMGWHNMPKWHIDHILPLSSFRFDSEDDPEFKAAWALTNLRPVWVEVNLRKNAKREFLL